MIKRNIALLISVFCSAAILSACGEDKESLSVPEKPSAENQTIMPDVIDDETEDEENTSEKNGFIGSRSNDDYEYDVYSDHIVLTGFLKHDEYAEIPKEIDGISVTVIDGAFYFGNVKSIIIPDSITEIGGSAFHYCAGLTEINIPSSVRKIGSGAFTGCSGLTEIVIPEGVEEIGIDAFSYCTGLTKVDIRCPAWGYDVFLNCENLNDVIIPESYDDEIISQMFRKTPWYENNYEQ